MPGIGKFGAKTSYNVGDAVWVKGCPNDGVAHIVREIDTGRIQASYEVRFNNGMGIACVPHSDLKPAKPAEDAADQAEINAECCRRADAEANNEKLLERLTKCKPMTQDPNANPMAFFGFALMAASEEGADADLEAMRAMDRMAVSMGRSLGYCGAPRTNYSVGERVRVRKGVKPGFWDVAEGDTGTVLDPGLLALFPVDPMQPRGINVQWDNGKASCIYVTNLEPETCPPSP